jgi:RNA polymerase sigma factor (sigma-70 family)
LYENFWRISPAGGDILVIMSDTDSNLLAQFARHNSQDAFTALVDRHLNLVYSAALRQVRSLELAEEIAQSVFADLAAQATRLKPDTIITAWLYQVTRRTAIDVIRRESRRQARERLAAEMTAMNTSADWTQIEPLLDEAMDALDETDRAAVLLRFFENKSLREVGASLGTSDDAAQKRVSRAIDQLREYFCKRGATVAAGGLALIISANAVQAAPVGLAAAISAAAFTGATIATSTVAATTKTIAMTTVQKITIAATISVVTVAAIYQANQAARLRNDVQTLQQQQAPLAEQLERLQRQRDDATNRLGLLADSISSLKGNSAELLKLRAEVTRLRNETKSLQAGGTNSPEIEDVKSWVDRVKAVRQRLEELPERKIPELQFLNEQDWFNNIGKTDPLETDADFRLAFAHLRDAAKGKFARLAVDAMGAYAAANDNRLPDDPLQLKPFFSPPLSDADAILSRYKMLYTGNVSDLPKQQIPVMGEKIPADPTVDSYYSIGIGTFSKTSVEGYGLGRA